MTANYFNDLRDHKTILRGQDLIGSTLSCTQFCWGQVLRMHRELNADTVGSQ